MHARWFALAALLAIGCGSSPAEQASCRQQDDCSTEESCSEAGRCIARPASGAPSVTLFRASADSIEPGASVTLRWTMRGATAATLSAEPGEPYQIPGEALGAGSLEVSPGASTIYTLSARAAPAEEARATLQVRVELPVPDPPLIMSFKAKPSSVEPGQSSTLTWRTENASSGEVRGPGNQITALEASALKAGSLEVEPSESAVYTLSVLGPGGSAEREVGVAVRGDPPVIASFETSEETPLDGEAVTLSWSIAGARSIAILSEAGVALNLAGKDRSADSIDYVASGPVTLTLRATNGAGSTTRELSIAPRARVTIESFEATPARLKPGEEATVSWRVSGPVSALALTANGAAVDLGARDRASDSIAIPVEERTSFELTAVSDDGQSVVAQALVDRIDAPPEVLSFEASAIEVSAGQIVSLSWTTSGARSLTLGASAGPPPDISAKDLAADFLLVRVDETTTFTLRATSGAGASAASLTVSVGVPVSATLAVAPHAVPERGAATLSWTTSGASGPIALTASDGSTIDTAGLSAAAGSIEVIPSAPGRLIYTLSVPGFAGPATASATLEVTARPTITSFIATPALVERGLPVAIAWTSSDAIGITIEAKGSGPPRALDLSGQSPGAGSITDLPAERTTYTLTVTGLGATSEASSRVVEIFDPVTIDSFTASPTTIAAGESATIDFATSNATSIELRDLDQNAALSYTSDGAGGGTIAVSPVVTTDYELIASDPIAGSERRTLTVTVN